MFREHLLYKDAFPKPNAVLSLVHLAGNIMIWKAPGLNNLEEKPEESAFHALPIHYLS